MLTKIDIQARHADKTFNDKLLGSGLLALVMGLSACLVWLVALRLNMPVEAYADMMTAGF